MTDYIKKAVEEFREKFVETIPMVNLPGGHGFQEPDEVIQAYPHEVIAFLTQKLEHLAKQKDEEFMGMIGSDEPARPCNNCYNPNVMADKMCVNCASAEGRNFKAYELRTRLDSARQDKLQGGKE